MDNRTLRMQLRAAIKDAEVGRAFLQKAADTIGEVCHLLSETRSLSIADRAALKGAIAVIETLDDDLDLDALRGLV